MANAHLLVQIPLFVAFIMTPSSDAKQRYSA